MKADIFITHKLPPRQGLGADNQPTPGKIATTTECSIPMTTTVVTKHHSNQVQRQHNGRVHFAMQTRIYSSSDSRRYESFPFVSKITDVDVSIKARDPGKNTGMSPLSFP